MGDARAHTRCIAGIARDVFLCVSSFNSRAHALYNRLGYELVGELNDFVIAGASELLLRKRLVVHHVDSGGSTVR